MNLNELRDDNAAKLHAARERKAFYLREASQQLQNRNGSAEYRRNIASLKTEIECTDAEIRQLEREEREIKAALDDESRNAKLNEQVSRTAAGNRLPSYDSVARVGMEARTYNAGTDRVGTGFLADVGKAMIGDYSAQERLMRHTQEEQVERGQYLTRAVGSGNFAGLVVPQYLTELFAPRAQAKRPFADTCNRHDLPANGMTVNISRITTGTGVGLQATENTSVTNVDMDDTLLTEPVQTAAGQQTVSRQAVERGAVEEVVLGDLFNSYATALDSTLINQASTGLSAVSQLTSYGDVDPTAPELWPFFFQAQSKAEAALLGQATVDHVIMHNRRWNWLCAQVTTSQPFAATEGHPINRNAVILTNEYGSNVRGVLPNGLRVVVDFNVPTTVGTNQDEIYVVASEECHLWEDANAPVFIRAEQPQAGTLGILYVVYGYFAYSFRRYTNGMQKIGGTGLAAPAGF